MRLKHALISSAALLITAAPLWAAPIPVPVTLNPSADVSVLMDGSNNNYNSTYYLYLQGETTAVRRSLLRFDLSSYTGKTVDGNATLQLTASVVGPSTAGGTVNLYTIAAPNAAWGETSATWNNLLKSSLTPDTDDTDKPWVNAGGTGNFPGLGAPGDGYGATVIATGTAPSAAGTSITITIPASVIQNWIDHPADNAGILLRLADESDDNTDKRVSFYPKDYGGALQRPILKFNVVPEPTTGGLMLIAGGLLAARRRRK